MEEVTLKKLGLKHIRKNEQLEALALRGLKSITVSGCPTEYTLTIEKKYKGCPRVTDVYTASTLCEVIDKAYEVHVDGR